MLPSLTDLKCLGTLADCEFFHLQVFCEVTHYNMTSCYDLKAVFAGAVPQGQIPMTNHASDEFLWGYRHFRC